MSQRKHGLPRRVVTAKPLDVPKVDAFAELTKGSGNLQLTISGDIGHVHQIQETTSLANPNWQPVQSVTLTSDPQVVTLALPSGPKFWRVVAQ